MALAVLYLPAQKEQGVHHIHGFVRIPSEALQLGFQKMRIDTDGAKRVVTVPLRWRGSASS